MARRGPALVRDARTCAWCGFYGDKLAAPLLDKRRQLINVDSFLDEKDLLVTVFFFLVLMWHHSSSAFKSDSRAAMHRKPVILPIQAQTWNNGRATVHLDKREHEKIKIRIV